MDINNIYDVDDEISNIETGDVINCAYSGTSKQITLPIGIYVFECWGAQGGDYSSSYKGGKGGYSWGLFSIQEETTVYLYAGGAGNITTATNSLQDGGFNGGGKAYGSTTSSYRPTTGGGASDVRFGTDSLYARAIVAGGGGGVGGRYHVAQAGAGGGETGQDCPNYSTSYYGGGGGTQTAGGASYNGTSSTTTAGSFGVGGYQDSYYAGGGGGGWYGGGSGRRSGGGGGSGYVYTSESASNYPTGCLLNSDHYAIDWNTADGESSIPTTNDYTYETTETGHSGNGYVRIFAVYIYDPNLIDVNDMVVFSEDYEYTGSGQSITLPAGTYKLECWGAQGGDSDITYLGGRGGYSTGIITLDSDTDIYIYVGGCGQKQTTTGSLSGGFNGGGATYTSSSSYLGCSGGGASDIRIGTDSLYARVITAGGGGGSFNASAYRGNGGSGGGTTGGNGVSTYTSSYKPGEGGTQTSRGNSYYGTTANSSSYGTLASFGSGGSITYNYGAGGGGGWYGGGYAQRAGAGGGSGYVYTSSTASNYPSGCLLNSNYYLTEASTTDGTQSFLSPTGSTETGHSGNGYVRITKVIISTVSPGNYIPCEYDGTSKHIRLPEGNYKLECWGAQGGDFYFDSDTPLAYGGYGGYSVGYLKLAEATDMYLHVGGQDGYNGGGASLPILGYYPGCGGGASDIRIGTDSLYSRAIVAGGGGGATFTGGGDIVASTTTLFNGTVICTASSSSSSGTSCMVEGPTIPIVPSASYKVTFNNTVYYGVGYFDSNNGQASIISTDMQQNPWIIYSGYLGSFIGIEWSMPYNSGISVGNTISLKIEVYDDSVITETVLATTTFSCTSVDPSYGSYYEKLNTNLSVLNEQFYIITINGDFYSCIGYSNNNSIGTSGASLYSYNGTIDLMTSYSYTTVGGTVTVKVERVTGVRVNNVTLYDGTATYVASNKYISNYNYYGTEYNAQTSIPIIYNADSSGIYTITIGTQTMEGSAFYSSQYNQYYIYAEDSDGSNFVYIESLDDEEYYSTPPKIRIGTNITNQSGIAIKIEVDNTSIGLDTIIDTNFVCEEKDTTEGSLHFDVFLTSFPSSWNSNNLVSGEEYIITVGNDVYNCICSNSGEFYLSEKITGTSDAIIYITQSDIDNSKLLFSIAKVIYATNVNDTVHVKIQHSVGSGQGEGLPTFPFDITPQYENEAHGGNGGGLSGSTGYEIDSSVKAGTGGTQNAPGVSYYEDQSSSTNLTQPSFGVGGSCNTALTDITAVGGGGGWYGGGSAGAPNNVAYPPAAGGGGSGYVYTSSTASNYPSGCLLNSTYYLKNASTTGQTTRTGNGYIVITVVEEDSINIQIKVDNEWKTVTAVYVKVDGTWKATDGVYIKQNNTWLKSGS